MRVYCAFCGADNASRARFCRACRKLITLPGGSSTTPAAGSPWPTGSWAADEPSFPSPSARPGEPITWNAALPPAAYPRLDQSGALPPLPTPSRLGASPGELWSPDPVSPTAVFGDGRVEYLVDPRTGFAYDPRQMSAVLAPRGTSSSAFFPRVGALLVDYCILSVLWSCLVGVAVAIDSTALGVLTTFLGPALYFIFFWSTGGRTPGYRAAGLQLLRTDGSRVGPRTAVVRYLGTLLSLPFFFLGYLWMLWDPAGQTWHDKLADTAVIQS